MGHKPLKMKVVGSHGSDGYAIRFQPGLVIVFFRLC